MSGDAGRGESGGATVGASGSEPQPDTEPARDGAAVLVFDRSGLVVDLNDLAARLLSVAPADLRGRDLFALFPSDRRDARRAVVRTVFESEQPAFFEERAGDRSWDVAIYPVKEQTGEVSRVAAWVRDVTARRRAERALRASAEWYRTLVETSPDAITLTDLDGRIVAANARTLALHGCDDLEDFRSRFPTAWDLIVEADRERAARVAEQVMRDGALEFLQYRAYRKDRSTFPIELSASVVRDASGAPVAFMAVSRDVAGRRVAPGGLPERPPPAPAPAPGPPPSPLPSLTPAPAPVAAARGRSPGDAEPTRILLGERSAIVAEPAMARTFQLLRTLAGSDLPVILLGETGCGKEVAAFALHHWSPRRDRPFVTLNCAAIPDSLVESEFFGYERGAFSGAVAAKPGLFETAHGGTVFLDEVGDLAPGAQAKLLRALETRRISRLGGTREREVDVRIVAATNRELTSEVASERFRKDLFYRLGAAPVVLPPLRERPREIPLFARHFLDAARSRAGLPPLELSPRTLAWLQGHGWPGNVRELKFLMEYVAVTVERGPVEPLHLPVHDARTPAPAAPAGAAPPQEGRREEGGTGRGAGLPGELKALERRRILEALEAAGWVQKRAAALLAMPLRTFQLRLRQHGISTRRRGGA